jgi:hypothetical protein
LFSQLLITCSVTPIRRRRAMHHTRDAARLLVDVLHLVPRKDLAAYTEIVGTLNTLEQRLIDLAPPKS